MTWRRSLERRFVRAILAGKRAKTRAAFKDAKADTLAARMHPPPDRHTVLAADQTDTLDCMNPFEATDAFAAHIDAGYGAPQDWNFPQL
jgi:hypothetical protein